MAHPNKKEGVKGHNSKLKRMTRDYGAASKSFKVVEGELENGPQASYGLGSEGEGVASRIRGDRPRRTSAANPIATYKRGGRIKERDKAQKRSMGGVLEDIGEAVGPFAGPLAGGMKEGGMFSSLGGGSGGPFSTASLLSGGDEDKTKSGTGGPAPERNRIAESLGFSKGGKAKKRASGGGVIAGNVPLRAMGGRVRRPAATNINIIVSAPKKDEGAGGMQPLPVMPPKGLPAVAPPSEPPSPPMAGPPGAGGGPPGMPPMMPPPGATPPGMIPPRKRGGAVNMTAGAESGPGRLEKTAARARRQKGDKAAGN